MADNKTKTPFLKTSKRIVLPKSPAKFPKLDKPDTGKFALGKCANGVFETTQLFKADSEYIAKLTAELDALYAQGEAEVAKLAASLPTATAKDKQAKKAFETIYPKNEYFKVDTDKDGNETGYVQVKVKLNASTAKGVRNTFVIVDAKRTPMKMGTEIWGGTEMIVQANAKFYNLSGPKQSGISFELLGVQIINLVGPNGGGNRPTISANDFEDQDGYSATEGSDDAAPAGAEPADDDAF